MTIQDIIILSKKIGVGIAVFLIPTLIISSGLWATQVYLTDKHSPKVASEAAHKKPCEAPTRAQSNN